MPQKLVVLTGSGISAESGINTFRDKNGIWNKYDIREVATPEAWQNDPQKVLDFYNERRKKIFEAEPNEAHYKIAELEKNYDVTVITQNVDDLHERAGSTNVVHLHGEIKKCRSTEDPELIYEMQDWELNIGDICEKGSQLRPHIVWFGEKVPMMDEAIRIAMECNIFVVVGTSLEVYPAAGIIDFIPDEIPKYVIDPQKPEIEHISNVHFIEEKASTGMNKLLPLLQNNQ